MQQQFTHTRRERTLSLIPSDKIERAFLEEFAKTSGSIRITKTVKEDSQPIFNFVQEAK